MQERERLPLARYLPELERLSDAGADFILVAGQAVNFWALHFSSREPELLQFAPFTSKDVDLFGSRDHLYLMPRILKGTLKRFRDPRTTVMGVFTTDEEPSLMFELLRTVYGPVPTAKIIERSRTIGAVHVIDPLSLLISKAHNAANIDQEKRQDIKHVQMMVLASREHLLKGLEAVGNEMTPRMFIQETRYLLDFADDKDFLTGLAQADAALSDIIPVEKIALIGEDHPALGRFVEGTLQPFLEKFE